MAAAGFRAAALALACAACTSVAVDQRTFEGTRWRVAAINGRPTSAQGSFSFEFARNSFNARMGCNRAWGEYQAAGDALIPAGLSTTEMACEAVPPGPISLMTYEERGFRVLRHPMRIRWISGRQLILSNAAGSIQLERLP